MTPKGWKESPETLEARETIARRRRALAVHELSPDEWARRRWVPGQAILVPEVDPC